MKKMNNKGFSLVELIIVIAIMAILAAALAPQLIKYLEQSRESTDASACDTIKSCFNAAMSTEAAYKEITAATGTTVSFDIGANGVISNPNGISTTTNLAAELSASLADLAAPKASGKTKYTLSYSFDATTKKVSNITVVTA